MRMLPGQSPRSGCWVRPWPLLAIAALLPLPLTAQAPPSPEEVLGYPLGGRFTESAEAVRYLEALADASPRVRLDTYGHTPLGRPLVQAVISSPENLGRLDEILAALQELTSPATTPARGRSIAAVNPAVVYFSYGVHGNESSSTEAALWTAWDLARAAPGLEDVLAGLVVVIDPVTNPDGRDRYIAGYRHAAGAQPDPDPNAREHWEPWPGGRFNHYLFDLNRDWSWATQPETRQRLQSWERWLPQVHVDFHEMSYTSSYFFFPAAAPINPLYPPHTLSWGRYFGEANAAAFDQQGWAYYTGEAFDLFYPGFGDSWPSLVGAIGMTYEQAGGGRAGLLVRRPDGTLLSLRDRAERHRTSAHATLRGAAHRRAELLQDFATFHREGGRGLRDILLVPGGGDGRLEALVELLHVQGIRVEHAARPFRANALEYDGFERRRDFPAGTLRVPAEQPRARLAATLLQPEVFLDATYSYDVSAWSLPYAYGVEAHAVTRAPAAGWSVLPRRLPVVAGMARGPSHGWLTEQTHAPAPPQDGVAEPYAFLIPPGVATLPGLIRLLAGSARLTSLAQPFTLADSRWPAGTVLLARATNRGLTERIRAAGLEGSAVPVRTGLTRDGHDLGTETASTLRLPRLAVVTGAGVSPTSYGAHWFFLEQTVGVPFTALPLDRIEDIDLAEYDVIVVPDMPARSPTDAPAALTEGRADALRAWTRNGGHLVAVGGAARGVAGLADVSLREQATEDGGIERALRGREERQLERWERQIPGTILAGRIDPDHPYTRSAGAHGAPQTLFVLHSGGATFEPDERFETVIQFPADLHRVSGVISEENLARLSQSSWLATRRLGRGRVTLFADDPLFRHFWYGTWLPYVNALLVDPRF
jgi:hypothetical protein